MMFISQALARDIDESERTRQFAGDREEAESSEGGQALSDAGYILTQAELAQARREIDYPVSNGARTAFEFEK
jgi:hypothetical protein